METTQAGRAGLKCENCGSGERLETFRYFGARQVLCDGCADLPVDKLAVRSIYLPMIAADRGKPEAAEEKENAQPE